LLHAIAESPTKQVVNWSNYREIAVTKVGQIKTRKHLTATGYTEIWPWGFVNGLARFLQTARLILKENALRKKL